MSNQLGSAFHLELSMIRFRVISDFFILRFVSFRSVQSIYFPHRPSALATEDLGLMGARCIPHSGRNGLGWTGMAWTQVHGLGA